MVKHFSGTYNAVGGNAGGLDTGEDGIVDKGAVITATTHAAILLHGNGGHKLTVAGTLRGHTSAIAVWAPDDRLGSSALTITKDGQAIGTGAASFGIELRALANSATLNNAGHISGKAAGISWSGDFGQITNSGAITSAGYGIVQKTPDGELFRLHNTGTISGGGSHASFSSTINAAADLIINDGRMIGNILLGAGNDLYDGRKGTVKGSVTGADGSDFIFGGDGAETLLGGRGDDYILGGKGKDALQGEAGFDTVDYGKSSRRIEVKLDGSHTVTVKLNGVAEDKISGFEEVRGSTGNDRITGDAAANRLLGDSGNDTLAGGNGNDTVAGGSGHDTLDGGAGTDLLSYAQQNKAIEVTLNGANYVTVKVNGVAEDKIKNFESVYGSDGADKITGDSAANWLYAGKGHDIVKGEGGNDTIRAAGDRDALDGGGGTDTLILAYASKTSVTLRGSIVSTITMNGHAAESIKNFERVIGTGGAERIVGDGNNNVFAGGAGNDTLIGNGGNDTLLGGFGIDNLTGGLGADTFRFHGYESGGNYDVIVDFVHGVDRIEVDVAGEGLAHLPANFFNYSYALQEPDDFYIYDPINGVLYYDPNGNQPGGMAILAVFQNKPQDFGASDIWLL